MLPLRDRNPTSGRAYVTWLLIAINIGVWIFAQQGGSAPDLEANRFVYEHGAVPCEIIKGEPITAEELRSGICNQTGTRPERQYFPDKNVHLSILVSMFLHASWIHLLGNMLYLWVFGNNVEDRMGHVAYLAFYLAGGFVATLAQVAISPSEVAPLVGASGAVAAAMGAYLVWFPSARILTWVAALLVVIVPVPAWLVLSVWFGLQFFTSSDATVAWMAHVGGFVFGMAVAALTARRTRRVEWF